MNHLHHPPTLLVQILGGLPHGETSFGSNFHALAGNIAVKKTLESVDDTLDGGEKAQWLELVVEDVSADVCADHVGTDGVESDALRREVFAVAPGEAYYAAGKGREGQLNEDQV